MKTSSHTYIVARESLARSMAEVRKHLHTLESIDEECLTPADEKVLMAVSNHPDFKAHIARLAQYREMFRS